MKPREVGINHEHEQKRSLVSSVKSLCSIYESVLLLMFFWHESADTTVLIDVSFTKELKNCLQCVLTNLKQLLSTVNIFFLTFIYVLHQRRYLFLNG